MSGWGVSYSANKRDIKKFQSLKISNLVYLSVSILRMMAYSIIALNMLKMQMTMYLDKCELHPS